MEDSAKPGRLWKSSPDFGPSDALALEYAVAGRVSDKATGDLTYFVAGAGSHATEAAAEFITQEKYLQQLPKGAFAENASVEKEKGRRSSPDERPTRAEHCGPA